MSKLSIITVNLNNAAGLRKSIESVHAQTFKDFEYIIIDGGSSDGSIDVIKEFESDFSYWVSEPDGGIFQGMNKGIAKAIGEYVMFVNSEDCLPSKQTLSNIFSNNPTEDIIYGDAILKNHLKDTFLLKQMEELSIFSWYFSFINYPNAIMHTASITKRDLFLKYGVYRAEEFDLTADWVFFLHVIYKYSATYIYLPIPFVIMTTTGISSNPANWGKMSEQLEKSRLEFLPKQFNYDLCRMSYLIDLEQTPFVKLLYKLRLHLERIPKKITIIFNKDFWRNSSTYFADRKKVEFKYGKCKFFHFFLFDKAIGKDIYIWGTGIRAPQILALCKNKKLQVRGFLDSNKKMQNLCYASKRIYAPQEILKKKNIFVIIASNLYTEEIAKTCECYGLLENKDFYIPFHKIKD
jgi:glycosyltransferase involved in cell wall biosynthesis